MKKYTILGISHKNDTTLGNLLKFYGELTPPNINISF